MKRFKTFKAVTAAVLAALYFFSLAPQLLALAPPSPAARPSATPVPGTPPLSAPATQAVCPVVFSISPSSLRQGQTATLVLSGSALNKLTSVSLGTGITVKSLNNANPGSAQVAVEVAANAPLGPHVLMLIAPGAVAATGAATGCGTREARPRLQILPRTTEQTPGFIAPPTQPQKPPITAFPPGTVSPLTSAPIPDNEKKLLATSLYPNQWARGQSYTANLVGLGFTTDMQIQLGEGVQVVGPLKLFSPNLVQIKLEVSGSAAIGEHRVQLRLNNQDPWTMTQAAAWVQSPSSQGLALMQLPAQDLASLVLGKIDLLQPVYGAVG